VFWHHCEQVSSPILLGKEVPAVDINGSLFETCVVCFSITMESQQNNAAKVQTKLITLSIFGSTN
jgi:hypothetical protein